MFRIFRKLYAALTGGNGFSMVSVFKFIMWLIRPIAKRRFNYEYDELNNVQEPILVLANHNTDWDCIFVGLAAGRQLYFVATEKLMRMGIFGKLVVRLFEPILHYKGKRGVNTIKAIYGHIRKGHNVAMFPEGNRSFNGETCPIPPATAKLARTCGATLVTYRLSGGYFSSPRWGKGIRKGRVIGSIAGIYSPEQLKNLSDDEIREHIERDLYVNAYEEQQVNAVQYRGKNRAEGLESMLFMCPSCFRIGTLTGRHNSLTCPCGYAAEYDEYGYLSGADGNKNTILELDKKQRAYVEKIYRESGEKAEDKEEQRKAVFTDWAVCEVIDSAHHISDKKQIRLEAFHDRIKIGEEVIFYRDIEGLAINERNLLIVHFRDSDSHFEISGPPSFSALKYLYFIRAGYPSVNGIL